MTWSISTFPWMGCYSIAGLTLSIILPVPNLCTWVGRGTVREKYHNTVCWPGLEPRPSDPESSALCLCFKTLILLSLSGCHRHASQGKIRWGLGHFCIKCHYYRKQQCSWRCTGGELRQDQRIFPDRNRCIYLLSNHDLLWHG